MIDDENENQQGITAYHGSPYYFDKFDMSKIGTGEGNQSYGHGLYFAEHEPVAKKYRDKLSNYISDEMLQTYFKPGSIIPGYVGMDKILNYDREKRLVTAQGIDPQGNLSGPIRRHGTMPDLKELNEEFKRRGLDPYVPGHMYEVAIDAHPDHMLDWDKPLSEQSLHIGKSIFDARKDNPTLFNVFKPHLEKDSTGMGFYQSLATHHPNGYQGASDFLQRAGIRGIKYLDAGSRNAQGDPTHNYVVFDHNRVKVKRRYKKGGRIEAYGDGGHIPVGDPRREENLAAWHKGSHPLLKNKNGKPKTFYHATQADFSTFNRGHKGIFVSPDPEFAQAFSETKGGYNNTNIMPVYVHAKNPFDYENPNHVEKLKKIVRFKGGMTQDLLDEFHDSLPEGQWDWVEHPDVQDAIKKLGHDGYYINETEDGEPYKNLAVYNPNQIKSATGNNGQFDPSNPDIRKAEGGYIERTKRATGGRIPEVDKLFKAAKRELDSQTKPMLNVHDDAIVNALRIAQGRV